MSTLDSRACAHCYSNVAGQGAVYQSILSGGLCIIHSKAYPYCVNLDGSSHCAVNSKCEPADIGKRLNKDWDKTTTYTYLVCHAVPDFFSK